jgi:hypothetical protein
MTTSNFFTAFYSALADARTYYELQKEMNVKTLESVYLNLFNGKTDFQAVVLSVLPNSDNTQTKEQSIRVRPLDIHNLILPEPCTVKCPGARKALISLHPVAYSAQVPTSISSDDDGSAKISPMSIRTGDVVTCRFSDGPANNGKMRGLTFEPMTRGSLPQSNMNLRCLREVSVLGSAAMFGGGGYEPVPIKVSTGKISNGKKMPGGLNIGWSLLKRIGNIGILSIVLEDIAGHESGKAGYDAYNRGACSDCGSLGTEVFRNTYAGKSLSELTIDQVINQVQKGNKLNGKSAFAVGKYQMVPRTLREAIQNIKGVDTNELFGKNQQEALGAYLVLMKRPTLGKYLLGTRGITSGEAQTAMSQEWAGIRIIEATTRPKSRRWLKRVLKPGESYYSGVGSNPANIKIKSAEKTAKAIEKARQMIDQNLEAQKIIEEIMRG